MKGIIFTEFLELVEEKFGLTVLDDILDRAGDEGVYTAVGSYDHRKLVSVIVHLSQVTGLSVEQLQEVFGEAVFDNLLASISNRSSLHQCHSTFQFIRHVEEYIHVEVKKLYPDAKPPEFIFIEQDRMKMVFDYKSARCMGHVLPWIDERVCQAFWRRTGDTDGDTQTNRQSRSFQCCFGKG